MARRGREDRRAELIGGIYEAAFDTEGFGRLGALLADAAEATNGVVVVRERGVPTELATTTSPEAMQAYLAYYGRLDPWTETTFRAPLGAMTRSEEAISDEDLQATEFYQDYARHLGIFRPAGTTLSLAQGRTVTVGVSRPIDAPRFLGPDETWLLELAQHIRHSLRLRERSLERARTAQAGSAALDALSFAALVVDARSKVVYANAAAEELASNARGLVFASGRLTARDIGEARALAALVHGAATCATSGAMRISDAQGETEIVALVAPVTERVWAHASPRGLALVAARVAEVAAPVPPGVLASLFGLSATEARLASALAAGSTLEDVATDRAVKLSTLRTQLLSVFRKTNCTTQRDLVRLLTSLPQVRW